MFLTVRWVLERMTTKTKETREIYLPEHLMQKLLLRVRCLDLGPADYLFFNESPKPAPASILRSPLIRNCAVCATGTTSRESHPLVPPHSTDGVVSGWMVLSGDPAHQWA